VGLVQFLFIVFPQPTPLHGTLMAVIDLRYRGALPFGALALILLPGAAVAQTKPFAGHGRVGARTLVASLDLPEREVSSSPPSVPAKPLVFGEPSVSTSPSGDTAAGTQCNRASA
jgi:hypothetical protein